MKFLITEATGFIGRNMVSFILQKGHSVQILALPNTVPDSFDQPAIEVFYGDFANPDALTMCTIKAREELGWSSLITYQESLARIIHSLKEQIRV